MVENSKFNLLLLIVITILGGIGEKFIIPASMLAIIYGFYIFFKFWHEKRNINTPPGFLYYLLFFLLSLFSLFWSENLSNSVRGELLLLAGGLIWIVCYNLSGISQIVFGKFIVLTGLYFGFVYVLNLFFKFFPESALNLATIEPVYRNHIYLGDLWAVILVTVLALGKDVGKLKVLEVVALIFGLLIVAVSMSRAAIISLIAGLIYIFSKNSGFKNNKFIFLLLILISSGVFILLGLGKSLIFVRPDYWQTILDLLKYPFGIGWGNFYIVNPRLRTELVHNIILEVISTAGIFALPFVVWFVLAVKQIVEKCTIKNIVYGAVFWVLGVNFFFGITYSIPTLFFIWMASLGLFQRSLSVEQGETLTKF